MILLILESNEQNKLRKWRQTHGYREQTDSCQRGGELRGWVKKVKVSSKTPTHGHCQQHGEYQREGIGGKYKRVNGLNGGGGRVGFRW